MLSAAIFVWRWYCVGCILIILWFHLTVVWSRILIVSCKDKVYTCMNLNMNHRALDEMIQYIADFMVVFSHFTT